MINSIKTFSIKTFADVKEELEAARREFEKARCAELDAKHALEEYAAEQPREVFGFEVGDIVTAAIWENAKAPYRYTCKVTALEVEVPKGETPIAYRVLGVLELASGKFGTECRLLYNPVPITSNAERYMPLPKEDDCWSCVGNWVSNAVDQLKYAAEDNCYDYEQWKDELREMRVRLIELLNRMDYLVEPLPVE
jgi:hypothetical protein